MTDVDEAEYHCVISQGQCSNASRPLLLQFVHESHAAACPSDSNLRQMLLICGFKALQSTISHARCIKLLRCCVFTVSTRVCIPAVTAGLFMSHLSPGAASGCTGSLHGAQ